MRDGWRRVPFGDFAALAVDRHRVEPTATYIIAGVLNRGLGLFLRGTIRGSETNYSELTRITSGQLVMRKLTAWEGPITVVEDAFDGCFVSPEFPTFVLDRSQVEPDFVRLVCQQSWLWDAMRLRVKGTVQRRKRLNPSDLLGIEIPLPPVSAQRRIVDLTAATDKVIERSGKSQVAATRIRSALMAELLDIRDGWTAWPLRQLLADTVGGVWGQPPGVEEVDVQVFRSTEFRNDGSLAPETATGRSISRKALERRRLHAGDILLEKSGGGPLQPVGRVVLVTESHGDAVCSNFVQLIRPNTDLIEPHYLFAWLWHEHSAGTTLGFQSQTTGIRNLRTQDYLNIEIAVPPLDQQRQIIDIIGAVDGMRVAAVTEAAVLESLRPAMLQDLLAGMHEIPESYDAILANADSA